MLGGILTVTSRTRCLPDKAQAWSSKTPHLAQGSNDQNLWMSLGEAA